MAISPQHFAEDIQSLLSNELEPIDVEAVVNSLVEKKSGDVGKLIQRIARDIQARVSTFNYPEDHALYGLYQPSRHLMIATRYLDEIGKALKGEFVDEPLDNISFDEMGWHAFGSVIKAMAGLLQHIEQLPTDRV